MQMQAWKSDIGIDLVQPATILPKCRLFVASLLTRAIQVSAIWKQNVQEVQSESWNIIVLIRILVVQTMEHSCHDVLARHAAVHESRCKEVHSAKMTMLMTCRW